MDAAPSARLEADLAPSGLDFFAGISPGDDSDDGLRYGTFAALPKRSVSVLRLEDRLVQLCAIVGDEHLHHRAGGGFLPLRLAIPLGKRARRTAPGKHDGAVQQPQAADPAAFFVQQPE